MSATAVLAILVLLGGGVSVAARSALPGHLLYPVKVNVNEEVRAALASSDEAKAKVDADRAEERLEEAEEVSVEEDVDAQTRADIEANFKLFADSTEARITALADVDARAAADIASEFETALRVHEKVLARLVAGDAQSSVEVHGLQTDVDDELEDTVKARLAAEAKVKTEDHGPEVKAAAQGKLGAAANVIAEVTRFISNKKAVLGADAVAKAEARLKVAEDLKAQADAKLAAGAYSDAFILGNAVIRTAQEAKLLIEAQEELDVDLHLGGRPSVTPTPHPTPKTEGMQESEAHDGEVDASARVEVEFGF
jgi:hypothetical protein